MFRGLRFIISFRFTYVFMYSALQLLHLKLCNNKERNSRFNFAFEVEITFHAWKNFEYHSQITKW